ncbi:hypothetical protein [Streptomyces sp. NPDC059063]|uniref:hypothetical protein n=1 Tax=unclassified Streptomyces TaxID=2593676 RepID=UPI0036CF9346
MSFFRVRTLRKATAVMRHSPGLRRVLAVLPPCAAPMAAHGPAVAAPPGRRKPRSECAKRYHAVRRGGVVRAADAAITCGDAVTRTAMSCLRTRVGHARVHLGHARVH